MKPQLFAVAALAAAGLAGAAQAAEVEIKDAVLRVVVVPQARQDIKVEISRGPANIPAVQVRNLPGGKVVIDGGLDRQIQGCNRSGIVVGDSLPDPINPPDNVTIRLRDRGTVNLRDLPLLTIYVPMDAKVKAGGAVFGSVGRTNTLNLGSGGCGAWTVANVRGRMELAVGGSGDIRAGTAGDTEVSIGGSGDVRVVSTSALEVNIGGSGDVTAQQVNGALDVSIGGSGDVKARQTTGPVKVTIGGSGNVDVKGGQISSVGVTIAGSGDVTVDADVGQLDASLYGGGDVRVRSAGKVNKRIMGGGSVTVGAL